MYRKICSGPLVSRISAESISSIFSVQWPDDRAWGTLFWSPVTLSGRTMAAPAAWRPTAISPARGIYRDRPLLPRFLRTAVWGSVHVTLDRCIAGLSNSRDGKTATQAYGLEVSYRELSELHIILGARLWWKNTTSRVFLKRQQHQLSSERNRKGRQRP